MVRSNVRQSAAYEALHSSLEIGKFGPRVRLKVKLLAVDAAPHRPGALPITVGAAHVDLQPRLRATPSVSTCTRTKVEHPIELVKPYDRAVPSHLLVLPIPSAEKNDTGFPRSS